MGRASFSNLEVDPRGVSAPATARQNITSIADANDSVVLSPSDSYKTTTSANTGTSPVSHTQTSFKVSSDGKEPVQVTTTELDSPIDPLGETNPRSRSRASTRKRWLVIALIIVCLVAAIVGITIGATASARQKSSTESVGQSLAGAAPNPNTLNPPVNNQSNVQLLPETNLVATQWVEANVNHYRVYYQASNGMLWESAWDNDTASWSSAQITRDGTNIKSGTSLAAVVGYPHANTSYTLVKNVYYLDDSNTMYEHQAPGNGTVWANNNFSGLFKAATTSALAAVWQQDLKNNEVIISIVWQSQQPFAASLEMGRYIGNHTSSYPWTHDSLTANFKSGSPIAMAPTGSHGSVMLYASNNLGDLSNYRYNLTDGSGISVGRTPISKDGIESLTVLTQDNRSLFSIDTLPECARNQYPFTHLIMYTTRDRSGVGLYSWNCTDGFTDQSSKVRSLRQKGRQYLKVSSHGDSRAYVLYDGGQGREIEEWAAPIRANQPWQIIGTIPRESGK